MHTNKPLRIQVTRTTVLDVPKGAHVIAVQNGQGHTQHALKYPETYLAKGDGFGLHDVTHYHAWVDSTDVEGI